LDKDKVNLYFVDFAFLGADSKAASEASYCADEQGRYWDYHGVLYNNQGGIQSGWADISALKQFALDIGLDKEQFDLCLDSGKYSNRVDFNKQVGVSNDVDGTPTFLIVGPDGSVERIVGPQPSSVFSNTIEAMLS
jgi:protein-disulfide isomerase